MDILRFFVCAYASYFEHNSITGDVQLEITQEGIWAHSPDEAVGMILSNPEYADRRPLDPNGVQVIEISTKLAEDIIANNIENA